MKNSEALERLKAAVKFHEDNERALLPGSNPEFIEAIRVAIAALGTLAPDWESAPPWAKWWAQDENGSAYWYRFKPRKNGTEWNPMHYEDPHAEASIFPNWAQSLEQRPKNTHHEETN